MSNRLEQLRAELDKNLEAGKAMLAASEAKNGEWTDDDRKVFDGIQAKAIEIKGDIERLQALGALEAWKSAPDGNSAVKQSFGLQQASDDTYSAWAGETVSAADGNIPGLTMTPIVKTYDERTNSWRVSGGELVPMSKSGEKRLELLKSAAYKDALVSYLRAAARGGTPAAKHMKVLQEGVDSAGGNFVLPDMRQEIIQKQATVMSVGNDVYSFPTGSNMVSFGRVAYSTDDKYTTGIRFGWTAESPAADISEATNPVSGRVNIPVHTATAAVIVTRELLEDSYFDILGFLSEKIGEAFGLGLDSAFVDGDGIGKPQGILSHTNASVAHASGGMQILSGASAALAWGTGGTTGVTGVEAALPPQYESGARWYANKATWAALRGLNSGTATLPQWSLGDQWPSLANGYQPTLLGYPTRRDQFMPDVGASNRPLILGDLKGYYAPMRTGITIDVLRELRALRGEVVIYARQRVGGQLVEDYRVKVLKSNNS